MKVSKGMKIAKALTKQIAANRRVTLQYAVTGMPSKAIEITKRTTKEHDAGYTLYLSLADGHEVEVSVLVW